MEVVAEAEVSRLQQAISIHVPGTFPGVAWPMGDIAHPASYRRADDAPGDPPSKTEPTVLDGGNYCLVPSGRSISKLPLCTRQETG